MVRTVSLGYFDGKRAIFGLLVIGVLQMTNPYKKDVSNLSTIDIYGIADLYDIYDNRQFHALKKILCAGKRGAKNKHQDLIEAMESIVSLLEKDDSKIGGYGRYDYQNLNDELEKLKKSRKPLMGSERGNSIFPTMPTADYQNYLTRIRP